MLVNTLMLDKLLLKIDAPKPKRPASVMSGQGDLLAGAVESASAPTELPASSPGV